MAKGRKLANYSKPSNESETEESKTKRAKAAESIKLTKNKKPKLVVSFGLKLENNFNFKNLNKEDLKIFQQFLDDSTELSYDEMENRYSRKNDSDDTYKINNSKFQIYHYGKDRSTFRLHGILADGLFHVIRIDSKHKVHKN